MNLEAGGILDPDLIEDLIDTIQESFEDGVDNGEDNGIMEIMCGASLAHQGLLSAVEGIDLQDDLSPVPAQHLASLVSCVPGHLSIENVIGCDMVTILTSLKCERLRITRQSLGREETKALVQAMESGVEDVWLNEEVTLDIDALTEYSGRGVCGNMCLSYDTDTAARYRQVLATWASSRNWNINIDSEINLTRGSLANLT